MIQPHINSRFKMTSKTGLQWSVEEKSIAQAALKHAYKVEAEALIQEIRDKASLISTLDELWQLNNFLSARRHDIDGKYDNQEESLLYALSRLVKEGWLTLSSLEGLSPDKQAKIKVLTLM